MTNYEKIISDKEYLINLLAHLEDGVPVISDTWCIKQCPCNYKENGCNQIECLYLDSKKLVREWLESEVICGS